MIKKLISKLLGQTAGASAAKSATKPVFGKRTELPESVHHINPALVDERATEVVRTLQRSGFEAYIVGGAVRDLLVGLKPKDFDVATNATPEEVKRLFRRAFIIGRRFRIVHVVFGRGREHEIIEVSTFRAYLDAAAAEQVSGNEKTSRQALAGMKHAVDASGRVLRDNVWGSMQEDAARRDFSVNAMYYDPERQIVVDFHGGLSDVQKRTIRMIGNAAERYREDPVRIIRAIRFAAKLSTLGFALDRATQTPLKSCLPLLAEVPQSRLFDEMLKLLQTGHATASIAQLQKLGLQSGIYPLLSLAVQRASTPLVQSALQDTDRRIGEGKPVAPSYLLACLLWQDVRSAWIEKTAQRIPSFVALQQAIDEAFDARIGDVSGRGKLAADMREIWMMQPRFDKRTGASPYSLAAQLRFRAGLDFLRLRAVVGEISEDLPNWWQTFSLANDAMREDLIAQAREQLREQQRAQQRALQQQKQQSQSKKTADKTTAAATDDPASSDAAAPAPKPRRPRRKSSNSKATAPAADTPATATCPEPSEEANADTSRAPKKPRRRKPAASASASTPNTTAGNPPAHD